MAHVQARIAEIRQRFGDPPLQLQQQLAALGAPVQGSSGAVRAAGTSTGAAATTAATSGARAPAGTAVRTPAPSWAERLPATGRRWAGAITETANRHGLDPRLLASVVWAESGFDPDVVSHAGAIGLAQLMPGTAQGLGVDPTDPLANLDGGARYLKEQLGRFGRVDLALAAYNAGPGRVAQAGGVPRIAETQQYVHRVAGYWESLQ